MSLTEVIVVMVIISGLSVSLSMPSFEDPFLDELFRSDVLHTQMLAFAYQQTIALDERWGVDIRFNANGNINEPLRMSFIDREVVLRLGTGRFDVPRLSDD